MKDFDTTSAPPEPIRTSDRLDPETFQLPVEKMHAGYYSDKYFVRAREVLAKSGPDPVVTMQVFQKTEAFVAGTDEAIAILKLCQADGYSFSDLEFFVVGVARDVCVTQAIDGMQARNYHVTALPDAM
jgi:hypothetical protein